MIVLANTPSLGFLFGLPIAVAVILAALYVGRIGQRMNDEPYGDRKIAIVGGYGVAIGVAIGTAIALWPWSWQYHSWTPVDGRVDKISSRFVSAGDKGGTNQRFVVVVDGQQYAVDDTRASLLKVGDTVHLKCKREFVWGSTDGWGCNWNGGPS